MRKHANHHAEPDSPVHTAVVSEPGDLISRLIQNLSAHHVVERERSRAALVALGGPAVGPLLGAFASADERGRLEICKALTEIADRAATRLLIECLEDDHQDLRWIAAEGLLNIDGPAVEPLLVALIDRASAHTILDAAATSCADCRDEFRGRFSIRSLSPCADRSRASACRLQRKRPSRSGARTPAKSTAGASCPSHRVPKGDPSSPGTTGAPKRTGRITD